MRFKLEECPYVSKELIDEAKKSLPPDIYKQEYEAAFVDSSNDVFVGVSRVSSIGEWREGGDAFVGIDTGLSDDSSVLALISPIGRVLRIESITNTDINTVATRFSNIMGKYNIVGGHIETNGIGRATYDLIQPKFRKIKPFNTNQDNKTDMVRTLINDIETGTIELPSEDLCPQLHTEFAQYTYKMSANGKLSFGHISGGHDDHIDAILMANYSRKKLSQSRPIYVSGGRNIKPVFG